MEGVVVSAKKDGSTISVSVVTDAQGRYAFPAARLEPGRYTLKARAAGYEIDAVMSAVVVGWAGNGELCCGRVSAKAAPATSNQPAAAAQDMAVRRL